MNRPTKLYGRLFDYEQRDKKRMNKVPDKKEQS